ncbi:MAG: hypothetical protein KAS67_02515, partial [Thermoplasmata archaeon]|nr:hypothetical protein [Thermoplasmata archaeon]
ISAPVVADTEVVTGGLDIVFDTDFMLDEKVWMSNVAGTNPYNLGEGDGLDDDAVTGDSCDLRIRLHNTDVTDAANDFYVNITSYTATVFDFEDTVTGTAGVQVSVGPLIIAANGYQNFDFNFDVLATNIALGTSTNTAITLTWDYLDDNSGTPLSVTGNTGGYIYLSSIFDDPANDPDEQLPNMEDEAEIGDPEFEAGDTFEEAEMDLLNYELGTDNIDDLTCVVTPPGDGITFSGDRDTCIIPGGIDAGVTDQTLYRVDVAAQKAPGIYDGSAVITYTRADSDLRVTENDLLVEFEVDFSFDDVNATDDGNPYSEFQCRATSVTVVDDDLMATRQVDVVAPFDTIEQPTYTDQKIRVNVTIENNGNTDLYNVEFEIDPDAWGANDYFRNPRFFYHETGAPTDADSITHTEPLLIVGDTINFTIEMIVVNNIPIGEHRLPIIYNGFYFNGGELDDASGFIETNGGEDLEIIFSIVVTDSAISCHATVTVPANVDGANAKNDIRANSITVNLVNDEQYTFIDVTVRANFNNTPWYNPIINMGDPWVWAFAANPATPEPTWAPGAGGAFDAEFWVDTDPALIPDRYPFQLEITAVINDTLQQVSVVIDYTRGCVIDFTGYGPELIITSFTADEIVPGETFSLELEITNLGDDTARDVFVSIPSDTTEEYDWTVPGGEEAFKDQFDWTGVFDNWSNASFDNFDIPDDMFYTMESLDVDNIREIVEINLYMDGVYSMPGSTIMIIKINDLAPGASTNCTFTMIADKDMVNGKPYTINVTITGIDPDNGTAVQIGDGFQVLEVMSSLPGSSYNPTEVDWFDTGIKALALLLFLIIIIAILLMVFNKFKGEGDDYDDEDEFGFEDEEDEYEPMGMEEPEAPAPEEEPPTVSPENLVEP